jgi:hypothetical protein
LAALFKLSRCTYIIAKEPPYGSSFNARRYGP